LGSCSLRPPTASSLDQRLAQLFRRQPALALVLAQTIDDMLQLHGA